jgi:hypothetical protein
VREWASFEPCEDVAGGLVDKGTPKDELRDDVGMIVERPCLGGKFDAAGPEVALGPSVSPRRA